MSTVISVEHLSKSYRLGQIGTGTFANDLRVWWAKTRGNPNPLLKIGEADHGNRNGEELWALHDVSFTVEQGEVLGIIGRNGAGKSTLLKILSRVTAPTSGKIKVRGRIASLLEVGTGFHPELTGRENIYLNGAILGMSRKEIDRKFDEIVDFSEVEKFIDTPVKRYSSGMYVRLAFAVAAHLDPEILIVDEVLAVGDAEFQKKCLGKMGDVAKEGRTVLFVSHNMGAIKNLCPQAVLIQKGVIQSYDTSESVIGLYLGSLQKKLGKVVLPRKNSEAYFESISIQDQNNNIVDTFSIDSPVKLLFCYYTKGYVSGLRVSFTLYNNNGSRVFYCTHPETLAATIEDNMHTSMVATVEVPGRFLAPGRYTVTAALHRPNVISYDVAENVVAFEIIESGSANYAFAGKDIGVVLVNFPWHIQPNKVSEE